MTSRNWCVSSRRFTLTSRRRTAGSSSPVRRYELATAAVILLLAAVAMFDTRRGALPNPTPSAPGGLASGFYPFWSAALVFLGAAAVAVGTRSAPPPAAEPFRD